MKKEQPTSGDARKALQNKSKRATIIISLLLVALILLLRLPFHAQYLTKWDSCNYAFALENFNIADHAPHPPGYPYYIAFAKIINSVLNDANIAFIYEGIILCCIAAIFIFLAGKILFGFNVGFFAALLFIVSPMSWYLSSVALSYMSEAALISAVLYLAIVSHKQKNFIWPPIVMALVMGFGAGFRVPGFLICAPIYLVHLLDIPWRKRIGSILMIVILIVGGYSYVIRKTGGWEEYRSVVASESVKHGDALERLVKQPGTEFSRNISQIILFARQSLGTMWFLLFLPLLFPGSAFQNITREKLFLWLGLLVPVLLFTVVYANFTPIMIALLPIMCLVITKTLFRLAVSLIRLFPAGRSPEVYRRFGHSLLVILWAVVAVPAGAQYIEFKDESIKDPKYEFSLRNIILNDLMVKNLIETAGNYDPDDTCFLLWMEAKHAGYYLRDYHVIWDKYLIRRPSMAVQEIYSLKNGKRIMLPSRCIGAGDMLFCEMELPFGCRNLIFRQDIESIYFRASESLAPYVANEKIGLSAISGIPEHSAIFVNKDLSKESTGPDVLWLIDSVQGFGETSFISPETSPEAK
jgi:hypothetical protein